MRRRHREVRLVRRSFGAVQAALGRQLPSELILRQHIHTTGLLHDALKLRAVDLAVACAGKRRQWVHASR